MHSWSGRIRRGRWWVQRRINSVTIFWESEKNIMYRFQPVLLLESSPFGGEEWMYGYIYSLQDEWLVIHAETATTKEVPCEGRWRRDSACLSRVPTLQQRGNFIPRQKGALHIHRSCTRACWWRRTRHNATGAARTFGARITLAGALDHRGFSSPAEEEWNVFKNIG